MKMDFDSWGRGGEVCGSPSQLALASERAAKVSSWRNFLACSSDGGGRLFRLESS